MRKIEIKGLKKPANYRWLVFVLLMGLYMAGLFLRLCLGVVKRDLEMSFILNPATYGALGGAFFYAYLLMQIPTGILADSWGPKKTALTGNFVLLLGTMIFATAPNLVVLFIGRILCGLGSAMVFIPITKIVAYWFTEKEFGAVNGLVSCLGYLAGLVAQGPLAWVLTRTSWRQVFFFLGFFVALVFLANWQWTYVRPEDKGMNPIPGTDSQAGGVALTNKEAWQGLKHLLTRKRSIPPAITAFGLFGSFNALTGVWGTEFVCAVYGLSPLEASKAIQYALIGMAIGSVTMTALSGKVGSRRRPIVVSCGLLTFFWGALVANTGGIIPYFTFCFLLFFLGYFSSALVLTMIVIKEMHLIAYAGMAVAIYNVGCFLGGAITAPTMGLLINAYTNLTGGMSGGELSAASYSLAFGFCLLIVLISLFAALNILETGCVNRGDELDGNLK